MDLSPRETVPTATRVRAKSKWPAIVVLVAVVATGGFVLTRMLTSAIDYYCNVDEIGVKDGCDEGRRLRIQGSVEEGSVSQDAGVTTFLVSFNGVEMPVRYEGDPGGVFQECIPVVVHGRLRDRPTGDGSVQQVFEGDRIEVKHSNEYTAANEDRLDVAEDACSLKV